MTFKLGLTGSIGMGKSTTAGMFAALGCPVWDADAAVLRLYDVGGAAVGPLGQAFPDALTDGRVDRAKLKQIIQKDATALKRIEAIVHPLVVLDRQSFIAVQDADILVLDIPLLFETGGEARMDAVVVATTDPDTQRNRVMERNTMTLAQFEQIKQKQMPDAEKRARADYVVLTDSLDSARQQVAAVVADIRQKVSHA